MSLTYALLVIVICAHSLVAQTRTTWREYTNTVFAHLLMKDTAGAIRVYANIVRGSGDSASAYLQRGLFYAHLKQYENALKDFSSAQQKEPENIDIYIARGAINLERKEFHQAAKDFGLCLALNSECVQAYYLRAQTAMAINDMVGAEFDLIDALRLDSMNVDIHYQRAILAIKLQQPEIALQSLNTAIRLDPGFAQAMLVRAAVLLDVGKLEQACQDLAESVKLGYKPALEMLRIQCRKNISTQGLDTLRTYVMEEVSVVAESDNYRIAAQEMKIIARRVRAIAGVLANRLTPGAKQGRMLSFGNNSGQSYFDQNRSTIVGDDDVLPQVTLASLELRRTSNSNIDDYIALTANRVALSKNVKAQKILNNILSERFTLRNFIKINNQADAKTLLWQIVYEISEIAEVLNSR